jgi:hypothetical protein
VQRGRELLRVGFVILDLIKGDQLLGRRVISPAPSAITMSAVVAAMPAGRAGSQRARPGTAIDAVPG